MLGVFQWNVTSPSGTASFLVMNIHPNLLVLRPFCIATGKGLRVSSSSDSIRQQRIMTAIPGSSVICTVGCCLRPEPTNCDVDEGTSSEYATNAHLQRTTIVIQISEGKSLRWKIIQCLMKIGANQSVTKETSFLGHVFRTYLLSISPQSSNLTFTLYLLYFLTFDTHFRPLSFQTLSNQPLLCCSR
jgi:hypothetical protein